MSETQNPGDGTLMTGQQSLPGVSGTNTNEISQINPVQAPIPAQPPQDPETVHMTTQQLAERMDRHLKAQLKRELGVDSPEALKAQLETLRQLKEAEAERERQAMSVQERLTQDLEAQRKAAQEAQEAREAAEYELGITRVCAELGVKNPEYAMFAVSNIAQGMSDEDELDAKAILEKMLEDPQKRAALGVEPPTQEVQAPATTTPQPGQLPPQAPPANPATEPKNAMNMSTEEWQRYKQSMGIL